MIFKIITLVIAGLGVAGAVVPVIPGPPLIFGAGFVYAWATGFEVIDAGLLWILAGLSVLAQGIDLLTGSVAPKLVGASNKTVLGAIVGGIVGLFFLPFGILLGPIIGAAVMEAVQGRGIAQTSRVAVTTGIGFIVGTIIKLVLSVVMTVMLALALF